MIKTLTIGVFLVMIQNGRLKITDPHGARYVAPSFIVLETVPRTRRSHFGKMLTMESHLDPKAKDNIAKS